MPLPDAEDTKTSNLYSMLRSSQLSTIAQADFDKVQSPVFIESVFEDEMRRLNLVGQASNKQSQSGPLVNTQKIVSASSDGSLVTIFRPDPNEVWEVVALSQTRTNASGSTTTAVYIYDGSNLVLVEELSDNSGAFPLNVAAQQPFRLTYDNYLAGGYSPSGNADAVNFFCSVIRVR